jgi:hypothetical protein
MIFVAVMFFVLELFPSANVASAVELKVQDSQFLQVSKVTSGVNQGITSVEDNKTVSVTPMLDIIERTCKIAAYFIGALWVYFNFFKGRTYRPRLEIKVTGSLNQKNQSHFLNLQIHVKNVGLSKVDIKQKGTGLRIIVYNSSSDGNKWTHLDTIAILETHQWIEPGESVEEPVLFPLAFEPTGVRIEVQVVSTKTMWETAAILV